MILFKVDYIKDNGCASGINQRFIIAPCRDTAVKKFLEIPRINSPSYMMIRTWEICKRDDIIPTLEPIKEFEYKFHQLENVEL